MQFTDEQAKAIQTDDKNLIVVAGAGSGKTRVLVERYLHLLDTHRDWRLNALVAITFTRAAALEMRDRVRKALEKRVQDAIPATDEHVHWSRLLAQMDSARIDTIHSMCATILRANAAEAAVDPQFEVLEPVESASLLNDVIQSTLYEIGENDTDDLAPLFSEYDLYNITEALMDADLLCAPLGTVPDAQTLFESWQTDWAIFARDEIQRVRNTPELADALDWLHAVVPPAGDKLTDIIETVRELWVIAIGDDIENAFLALSKIDSTINLRGGSAKNWGTKEVLTESKDYLRAMNDAVKDIMKTIGEPPADNDQRGAEMLVRWHKLLARVQEVYQQAKADASYLDFDDLEKRTAKLLAENEAVAQRYRGNEFKQLLVDEFQDTNDAQWTIVRGLTDFENDSALFLVGDPKQSIYAFRGADVSVFNAVREEVAQHSNGLDLPLSQSFRTHHGLVDTFNSLFSQILTRNENSPVSKYEIQFDKDMTAFRQAIPDLDATVYAPLELLIQQNAASSRSDDYIGSTDRRLWEAQAIAQRLQALKDKGALIHDPETDSLRPFAYGDAAMLFQSTTNIGLYEDIFEAMNIPFVTVAGRGYYNQQEVWDVLNLLKALHNPADNLSLASVLRSPMFSFTDEMLFALRQLRDEETEKRLTLWQAIQATDVPLLSDHQHKQCADAFDLLARLRVLAGRTSIAEFLRLALSETGYLATLTGLPNGTRLRRNVEKLIAIAQESGKITLSEFAYYLNDLTDREVRESKAALDTEGAVQLMTVHASKGLEFPVVVLVDAGWSNNRGTNAPVLFDTATGQLACKIYDDTEASYKPTFPFMRAEHLQKLRDDAERKRLLYVAATRARDCLIISGEVGIKKDGDLSIFGWLELTMQELDIDDLSEMRDGYTFDYANDGKVRVHLPTFDNASIRALQSSDEVMVWRELDIHEPVDPPPLTPPVIVPEQRLLGHISATQLANIGGYRYGNDDNSRRFYRQTVRRHIIDDTSAVIADVARTREPKVRPRQLGEIVHEALRYWRFPEQHANIDAILRSYAWQQNITDSAQVEDAVRRAHNLLEKFQQSKLYQRISTARDENAPYYPELPFIYRTDKRIIHGVIDLLFKHGDEWHLVDYKTSTVRGGYANIKSHAQRYHLQVGVYAAAVRQELQQQTPRVFIHYIQYNRTVEVLTEVWQRELIQLEKYIGDLLGDI